MEEKAAGKVRAIMLGLGTLLLLAAAFDITSVGDNTMIFLALACFAVSCVIKRTAKAGGTCCK